MRRTDNCEYFLGREADVQVITEYDDRPNTWTAYAVHFIDTKRIAVAAGLGKTYDDALHQLHKASAREVRRFNTVTGSLHRRHVPPPPPPRSRQASVINASDTPEAPVQHTTQPSDIDDVISLPSDDEESDLEEGEIAETKAPEHLAPEASIADKQVIGGPRDTRSKPVVRMPDYEVDQAFTIGRDLQKVRWGPRSPKISPRTSVSTRVPLNPGHVSQGVSQAPPARSFEAPLDNEIHQSARLGRSKTVASPYRYHQLADSRAGGLPPPSITSEAHRAAMNVNSRGPVSRHSTDVSYTDEHPNAAALFQQFFQEGDGYRNARTRHSRHTYTPEAASDRE